MQKPSRLRATPSPRSAGSPPRRAGGRARLLVARPPRRLAHPPRLSPQPPSQSKGASWLWAARGPWAVVCGLPLLALLVAGCSALAGQLPATGIGEAAPEMALVDVQTGEAVSLREYRGRVVLLNVWATWCGPCRAEMPALDSLQRERPDRLAVLYVTEEPAELVRAWRADLPGEGRHLLTSTEAFRGPYAAARGARPVTFLIDEGGNLRERIIGAQTAETFRDRVDAL